VRLSDAVREGTSLSQAIQASGQFPAFVSNLVAVGEESGKLETALLKVASSYERETDRTLRVFTVVLEPREIVFLWLVNRFRQRRDLMVVRGDFVARPPAMGELFRAEGPGGKEAHAEAIRERWPIDLFDANGLQLAASSPLLRDMLRDATQSLPTQLSSLLRLSIRDRSPHLLLNYTLRPGQEGHIGDVFRCVLDLAHTLIPTSPM